MFKHALIQDAAYASLLKSTRQRVHQQIVQLYETRFPDVVATQPEVVARHCTEAGLPEPASGYWQRAGQRALQSSAYAEAMAHLRQGLAVLTALPETPARRQQELDLQVALGSALFATQGHGTPEAAYVHQLRREVPAAHAQATAAMTLGRPRGLRRGWPGARSCTAGAWPCRTRARRAWPRYGRGSLPTWPRGPNYSSHISWACWRRRMGSVDIPQRGWKCWPRR
jgi:hypothetical protein